MSFVAGSSEAHQLWFLIPSQQAPAAVQPHHPFAMDHRRPARRRSDPHRRGGMHGAVEHQKQHRGRPQGTVTSRGQQAVPVPPTPPGYFTAELVLAFLFVAVSLAFLPLVLPPLSPPPFLLLLVPVGLLAVLLALAFVPLDAHSHLAVGSSR
ncbi:uncharacterized protein [Miscanthus floridulus]|uniref:uncharacterized protein n=1 Tax=Miscanthus floridulus TaxID=154761 RepID=UPI003459FD88